MAISPGCVVRDRYEVLEVLGHGGQGHVLRAMDHQHGRPVALKVRRIEDRAHPEETLSETRLLLEARPHPHLPLARDDFFWGDDCHVVVMDWVEGIDLARTLMARGAPGLPLGEVLDYLHDVAAAVDHLHGHDPAIVHGDIKPANIVVDHRGRAILVDFGIATRGFRVVPAASPGFTAPECATGRHTTASDIFSLAATAFALLSGAPPHPGAEAPWGQVSSEQAQALATGLRRGLAADPSRRPQSAGELVAMLAGERRSATNLPREVTTFVGRSAEVAETSALLRSARLVTLTGPGGVGKSRLALRVATRLASEFADGAFLVSLGSVSDPVLIATQALSSLGVAEERGRGCIDTLIDHLRGRRLLLLLDNCEHLADGCAEGAEHLLGECEHLRILATSRQPLGVVGEVCVRVPPLPVPPPKPSWSMEALEGYDAVNLFLIRAHPEGAAWPHARNHAGALAEICARLDGIPLAIELAAARARTLSLPELVARLDDRFQLLDGAVHTRLPRHRTLRAAVEWSWDLLETPERTLLRRLATFAGGWTLDSAEQVCPGDGLEMSEVAHWHCQLVDKSLISRHESDTATRYRMLDDVHRYAAERLAEAGEREAVAHRHLEYFSALAEADEAERLRTGNRLQFWRRQLPERANVRAALGWAETHGWPDAGLRLLASPLLLWRSFNAEARNLTVSALASRDETPPLLHGKLLLALATHDFELGNLGTAEQFCEGSLEAMVRAGDRAAAAYVQALLGNIALEKAEGPRAVAHFEEALSMARELGDISLEANILHDLGETSMRVTGDLQRAMTSYEAAIATAPDGAGPLVGLALVTAALGDEMRGVSLAEEALRLARENWPGAHDYQLDALAELVFRQGDSERAQTLRVEALELYRRSGRRLRIPAEFEGLAAIHAVRGDYHRAARLLGAAERLRQEMGTPVQPYDQVSNADVSAATRAAMGERAYAQARTEGRRMPLAESLEYAVQAGSGSPDRPS